MDKLVKDMAQKMLNEEIEDEEKRNANKILAVARKKIEKALSSKEMEKFIESYVFDYIKESIEDGNADENIYKIYNLFLVDKIKKHFNLKGGKNGK